MYEWIGEEDMQSDDTENVKFLVWYAWMKNNDDDDDEQNIIIIV